MAVGRCEQCGTEEYMPFVCKFCRGRYCASHRLPENHGCKGLEVYRERARSEGRLMMPEADLVRPEVRARESLRAKVSSLLDRLEGKAAVSLLVASAVVGVLQAMLRISGLHGLERIVFILGPNLGGVLLAPWAIFLSVLAHADFTHFLLNGMMLFFMGPALEGLIGSRRFFALFWGAGVLAGLTQVLVFSTVFGRPTFVLGASGAIMGVLGALTLLAPRLTVLVMFVIPAPLWAMTAVYAALDFLYLFSATGNVAHLAHLAGLAFGFVYGKKLKDRGFRAAPAPRPQFRRYF